MDLTTGLLIFIPLIVILSAVISSAVTTDQQEIKIIERFGKYSKSFQAGLSWKTPFIESVAGVLNLKLQQADIQVAAKTKDNVFISVALSVQYSVMAEKATFAFYKLQKPVAQIESFVFNIVRSVVPTMTLDETFVSQDAIALAVDKQLEATMADFGYSIYKVLVTSINAPASVVTAMNDVKAADQNKLAAASRAEATKITMIAQAEAEKETKRLSGEGIAAERQAIVDGMKEAVADLASATNLDSQSVMNILMTTQYYDTLKAVGTQSDAHVVMIPYGADGASKIREAVMEANLMK